MLKPLGTLLATVISLASAAGASGLPRDIPTEANLVYKWNLVGCPPAEGRVACCGSGDRLYVSRDVPEARVLVTRGARWSVTDCDSAGDGCGGITAGRPGVYDVYVRIQATPGARPLGGDTYQDWLSGETLCLVGTVDLSQGSGPSGLRVEPSTMFAAGAYDAVWSVDANPDYRICQLRVYERP